MGAYRGWGRPSYASYGGFGWAITPIVKKLLLVNAVVFGATLFLQAFSAPLYASVLGWLGLVPRDVLFGLRLWQPVTYLFLHGGFTHIFFNMFALWMFGSALERDWGGRRFLRYYFLTGVGAGLFSVLATTLGTRLGWVPPPALHIPTIGASGAIYGILVAFGLLYPHQPIYIWFLFPIPARVFVLIFGVLTFISALSAPGGGVSHVAHLGGMLLGLAYLRGGWVYYRARNQFAHWRRKQRRRQFEVYRRQQDELDRDQTRLPRPEPRGPDRWIH